VCDYVCRELDIVYSYEREYREKMRISSEYVVFDQHTDS